MKLSDKQSLILVSGDVLLAVFALNAGYALRFWTVPGLEQPARLHLEHQMVFTAGVLFSSFLIEMYSAERMITARGRAARTSAALILSYVLLSSLFYALPASGIGRGLFLLSLAVFGSSQFMWHTLLRSFWRFNRGASKVLVVGTGQVAQKIGGALQAASQDHVLKGYFSCDHEKAAVPEQEILDSEPGLIEVVNREKPQKIIITLTERRGTLPVKDILSCKLNGIDVVDAPSFYEDLTGKVLLEDLRPSWLIFSEGFRVTPGLRMYKRIFDIGSSVFGLLATLPLFPAIALAVVLDSGKPVFFRQTRVGVRERPFELIKFRTMRPDAELATGAVWAQKDDQRVTKVGRFLRKIRLDELPQLWNVLRGDMSLIGPRPERPEFVNELTRIIPFYSERHFVKPGITGWAQVRYPYGASVEDAIEKLRFDLFYIKNVSPLLDLYIVLETIKVVLFGRGGR